MTVHMPKMAAMPIQCTHVYFFFFLSSDLISELKFSKKKLFVDINYQQKALANKE